MVSNTTDYMHCPDWQTAVKDSEDHTLSHDGYHNAMNSGGGWVGAMCVWEWMYVIVCVDACDCACCVWMYVIVRVSYSSLRLGFGLTPLHHAEVAV